jgi:hypothetical protein
MISVMGAAVIGGGRGSDKWQVGAEKRQMPDAKRQMPVARCQTNQGKVDPSCKWQKLLFQLLDDAGEN